MTNIKYQIILWFCIVFFAVFFSNLSIKRYKTLNSYYYDLGIMNQVVYNTSQGRFLEMTNPTYNKNMSRLAIHFDPILAIFAPFYKIYEGPEVLLTGQAVILGLGAIDVFLISQVIIKQGLLSLLFSISYLLYFPIQRAVLFDFHAVTLATTFLLFAFYFNLVKKNYLYFLFIILSLLTKEHIGLVVFMFGLYLFFIKKERKIGLITGIFGLGFFILTVYVIIPYFRGEAHFATTYFSNIWLRTNDIIFQGFLYSKMLIVPAFFSLFSPLSFLIALPEWAINILSSNGNMRSILFHYNSIIVAVIYYSIILGYKNITVIFKNKFIHKIFLLIFIILNIRTIYLYNPVPGWVKHPVNYKKLDQTVKVSILKWQELLKNKNIKVATTPKLAPYFTSRRYYYNFLYDSAFTNMGITEKEILRDNIDKYQLADYVIINKDEIGELNKKKLPAKFYQRLTEDKGFEMVFSDDIKIEVYKKI